MSIIQLRLKNIEQRILEKIQKRKIVSIQHNSKEPENAVDEEKEVIGGSLLLRLYRRFLSRG